MPLKKGKSKKKMAWNYKEMRSKGASRKQAIAVMLKQAGLSRKKRKKRKK